MSRPTEIGLPEALERAASALTGDADAIRPANGDPFALRDLLDADAAVRVLEWLLIHETGAGAELATEWADAGGDASEPVKRISPEGMPKPARKALKRAQHLLRSRGESLPASSRSVVATLPKLDDALSEAMVSGVDPRGTRIATVVESDPAGGARLFVVALSETLGVVEFDVFSSGRSKIKRFLKDATTRKDFPTVRAPVDSVGALIARIAGYHPKNRPLPRAFSEWRSHIARPAEGTPTPGETARAELGDADDPARAVERIIALVRDGQLGPWPAANEVLQPIAEKLNDAATGVLIVSGTARQQQIEQVMDEAVDQVFDESFAARTAERFEESAYTHWRLSRDDDARACLTAASELRNQSNAGRAIQRALLESIFAPMLKNIDENTQESEGDAASLLVKP